MPADAFAVLGLSSTSSEDEVNRAFRRLAKRWHPDRFADASKREQDAAHARFLELKSAQEAALASIRMGGRRTQRGPTSPPPPPPPPPPSPAVQARRILEALLADRLTSYARLVAEPAMPVANLANRLVDATIACAPDIGRTGLTANDPYELAALYLTVLAMEPRSRVRHDPPMADFCGRISVEAIRELHDDQPLRFMVSLSNLIPDLGAPRYAVGTPGFCLRCLGAPAADVELRLVVGRGFWHRWERRSMHRCASCALPEFRTWQARQLEVGWWGLASFFLTPLVLTSNARQLRRARKARGAARRPEFSAPNPGPSTLRRGRAFVSSLGAGLAGLMVIGAIVGIATDQPPAGSAGRSGRQAAAASSTTTSSTSTTSTTTTTTTLPPNGRIPLLATTFADFKATYGKPVVDEYGFGPVVRSAGGRAPTYEDLYPLKGPIEAFAMNFPDGTSEAAAAAAVGRSLPADAFTTSRKVIYTYDNAKDQLVGNCLAWNVRSLSLTGRYLKLGLKQRLFIAMVFTSSTLRNHYKGALTDLSERAWIKDALRDDKTYRPQDVTRVEVWVLDYQPKTECFEPSYPSTDSYDDSYLYDNLP